MPEKQIILTGWKEICEAWGILSKSTMKKIALKYKLPIIEINGKPTIGKDKLLEFLDKQPLMKISR
jgi:hypothetical protein